MHETNKFHTMKLHTQLRATRNKDMTEPRHIRTTLAPSYTKANTKEKQPSTLSWKPPQSSRRPTSSLKSCKCLSKLKTIERRTKGTKTTDRTTKP